MCATTLVIINWPGIGSRLYLKEGDHHLFLSEQASKLLIIQDGQPRCSTNRTIDEFGQGEQEIVSYRLFPLFPLWNGVN